MAEEPHFDNPAGRLHDVLQRFGLHRNTQIIAAWNSALGVEPARVPYGLLRVGDLITATKQAYESTGLQMFKELPARLDVISSMVFQHTHPMTAAVSSILPGDFDQALQDILNLSRYLDQYGQHSEIPDHAQVAELVQGALDLIAAVANSDALLPEMKQLLIRQLNAVLETLELWRVNGPERVRMDVLAVVATVTAYERAVVDSEPGKPPPEKVRAIFGPIKDWAATALTVFALVNTGAQAIGTAGHALGLLPPPAATQVDVKVELPSPQVDQHAAPDGNIEPAATP